MRTCNRITGNLSTLTPLRVKVDNFPVYTINKYLYGSSCQFGKNLPRAKNIAFDLKCCLESQYHFVRSHFLKESIVFASATFFGSVFHCRAVR